MGYGGRHIAVHHCWSSVVVEYLSECRLRDAPQIEFAFAGNWITELARVFQLPQTKAVSETAIGAEVLVYDRQFIMCFLIVGIKDFYNVGATDYRASGQRLNLLLADFYSSKSSEKDRIVTPASREG